MLHATFSSQMMLCGHYKSYHKSYDLLFLLRQVTSAYLNFHSPIGR